MYFDPSYSKQLKNIFEEQQFININEMSENQQIKI